MKFHVTSKWVDSRSSASYCKNAEHSLDTTLDGNQKAFNPAEPLLGALSACMIKGILRAAPILDFRLTGIEVVVSGVRQDVPPKPESIDYEIFVVTDESDDRLELLTQKREEVWHRVQYGQCRDHAGWCPS